MTLQRRRFLQLAGAAAAFPATSRVAKGQTYPSRPIRWIVGFPPGGATDTVARIIGESLSEQLGQPVVIDNRPGASSNIGTEAVVRAPADGYTIMLVSPANAINATLYDKLPFNFIRDIAPVASINRSPFVMQVNPSFPAKTLPEFIAYAKANPGKLTMGSPGSGTAAHVTGGLFKMMADVDILDVPYRGEALALTDLIAGQVQLMFTTLSTSLEYLKAGTLRPLAVTTATRSDVLPDVPTIGEVVPGYEASTWNGVGVPRNTPPEIIDRLNKAVNAALADPRIKTRLAGLGASPFALTPDAFGMLIAAETEKWGRVVKFYGAKAN